MRTTTLEPAAPEALTVEERVANGLAFLDERAPGWRERVNADTLDMGEEWGCVLGQWRGSFYDGAKALGIGGVDFWEQTDRLGFTAKVDYEPLTEAWRSALRDAASRVER